MDGAILKTVTFNLLLVLSICSVLHVQPEFISLDCGAVGGYNDARGISWTSDEQYINSGEKRIILTDQSEVDQPMKHLRCFPQGKRNCYNLPAVRGIKYLIRACFLYGNYDGRESQPQFELLVDANFWATVVINNTTKTFCNGINAMARGPSINVCLARSTDHVPFISTLELRLLMPAMYEFVGQYLSLISRVHMDYGKLSENPIIRYPDDQFDRLWVKGEIYDTDYRNTVNSISSTEEFQIPSAVLETALVSSNKSVGNIRWNWRVPEIGEYYFLMCFAEVEELDVNAIREFNISINGYSYQSPVTLHSYLDSIVVKYGPINADSLENVQFSLDPTNRSSVGAIINALDIYQYRRLPNNGTKSEDVNAIADIVRHFNLEKEWMGDPCQPQKYSWDWVDCNQDSSPRIIAVDLARNNLSGSIPEALATLSNLKQLNLADNDLNGSVPIGLSEQKQRGKLILSVYGNEKLCQVGICKDGRKGKSSKTLFVWLIVAGIAILISFTALLIFIKIKSSRKIRKGKTETGHLNLDNFDGCRSFSFIEVRAMTSNFQTEIGKGGYGSVYLGCLQDKDVAVKILSDKSHKGATQFSTEVEILYKLHHKNLIKFMGYCEEEQNLVLVYEYMSIGDLRHFLDGQTSSRNYLGWERRLNIALDAAQGLEYLHVGCKPSIIHRDVKSSNILLNDQMEAKIADFGLSRMGPLDGATHVSTLVKGTIGYLDPEYYTTNRLTEKSDVYSFGVVLMEIISGKHPHFVDDSTSNSEHIQITNWVRASLLKDDIENIADPNLHGNYDKDAMLKVANLAMVCTSPQSKNRPTMNEVVLELKEAHHYSNVEFHEIASSHSHPSLQSSHNVDSDVSLYSIGR
ncbi:probable LRR receptor-like serine/threonine-protein kinase At1g51810 isoform X2 [Cryptomeria japonica]|uniref:probable LRR receptor-like serine/threonine-protein kinase At1g51810 isoform X2 n=1 Tax=Cryptomeria japonica TaxID=3369 RepID=UPI0027DAA61A|nr:probable LRR receptor-like serine/threonine-protein kinase At1g51810 isoform X2 [Cryptomeria japonica]